jgi:hypothetical protein
MCDRLYHLHDTTFMPPLTNVYSHINLPLIFERLNMDYRNKLLEARGIVFAAALVLVLLALIWKRLLH